MSDWSPNCVSSQLCPVSSSFARAMRKTYGTRPKLISNTKGRNLSKVMGHMPMATGASEGRQDYYHRGAKLRLEPPVLPEDFRSVKGIRFRHVIGALRHHVDHRNDLVHQRTRTNPRTLSVSIHVFENVDEMGQIE